jgi:hypothetical protein
LVTIFGGVTDPHISFIKQNKTQGNNKMKLFSEEHNQIYAASFLHKMRLKYKDFIFFHCPNSGSRNKAEASKIKLMGGLAGVLDVCIIHKKGMLWIEYKLQKGLLSEVQKDFIRHVRECGHKVVVIHGDTPQDFIKQTEKAMIDVFGYDQKGTSKISSSLCDALGAVKS